MTDQPEATDPPECEREPWCDSPGGHSGECRSAMDNQQALRAYLGGKTDPPTRPVTIDPTRPVTIAFADWPHDAKEAYDGACAHLADIQATVELADKATGVVTEKDGVVEVYSLRAADWNRVVAVSRGHMSNKARRSIDRWAAALSTTPAPSLREAVEDVLVTLERVVTDSESQHPGGWGPDITTVSYLRDCQSALRAALEGAPHE